jgi:DNA-binding NarL/FixJ family response regulator
MIAPIRLMLVDDHQQIRQGVRDYLSSRSIQIVAEAAGAVEALRKAKASAPDVIVLDVDLPLADGGQLALRLRRLALTSKLVAFGMHSGRERVERMESCGAHGYVTKDSPAELLCAIQSVSEGGRYFPKEGAA